MADKRVIPRPAAVLLLLLAGCSGSVPEERIRAAIDGMEDAVEARESSAFLEHVSEDFSGQQGALEKRALRGYLASLLVGNRMVEVTLGPPTITLHEGGRATVTISALVIGGAHLPERGQHLAIKSGWRLEDGDWKVYVAEWE